MTVWAGADWDKNKCVVEAECDGEEVRGVVKRHPEAVRQWCSSFGEGAHVVVGIEAGDPLWVTLFEQAGAEVYVFDPKKAKRYAQSLSSSNASDDKRSASTLRAQVQSHAHRAKANRALPPELRGLEHLLGVQDTVRGELNRQTNRLHALLRQAHPALSEALGQLDRLGVVRLLQAAPTPKAWLELSAEEQRATFKGFRQDRRQELMAAAGEDWTDMRGMEEEAARFGIRQTVAVLEVLLSQRSEVEERLEAAAREDRAASIALGVRGLGAVLSTGAAIALEGPEEQRDRMAVRTGTAPVTVKSGTRGDRNPTVRMRRSSGAKLRAVGYLIAVQLVLRHGWARAQYAHYRTKGINAAGAYRRVSRSFARVLAALVRDQVAFDEERYVAGLKARGVPWALAL